MKLLITGAGGHLGQAFVRHFSGRHVLFARTSGELDVCHVTAVREAIRATAPDAIINCAAYTDVDGAEGEPVRALQVNALAVRTLAAAARESGAVLVHFSTDFVFDGLADRPYLETDAPNPRSTYACSKLLGEWFAEQAERHYVLRVESLFGAECAAECGRRTSIDRIVDAIVAGEEARVFTDRVVTPSYAPDVTAVVDALLATEAPSGIYHCVNTGACTFLDVAEEAARRLGCVARLKPVSMEGLALRAQRPKYCALSNGRLVSAGIDLPTWQDALARYVTVRRRLA